MKEEERRVTSEIEEFLKEKEKIREVVGRIGGRPTRLSKLANTGFIILVMAAFAGALMLKGIPRLLSIEIGVLVLSLKFAYFLYNEARVNHFQFWILTSLEWRMSDLAKKLETLEDAVSKLEGCPPSN